MATKSATVVLTREQIRSLQRLIHTLPIIDVLEISAIDKGIEIVAFSKDEERASVRINSHGRPMQA